jgi:hypothetical protein
MSPETKLSHSREEKIQEIKDFIASANQAEIRLLDIALKERKTAIIADGKEQIQPAVCLYTSEIGGREYIYSFESIDGKKIRRKIRETDISSYDYASVKVSPKAKEVLKEKYGIQV